MSTTGARPIFVATGAFYARFDEDDAEHDRARRVFDAIRDMEQADAHEFTRGSKRQYSR